MGCVYSNSRDQTEGFLTLFKSQTLAEEMLSDPLASESYDRKLLYFSFLSKIMLFHGMDKKSMFGLIDCLEKREYQAGTTIIREGEPGFSFFILYEGTVHYSRNTEASNRAVGLGLGQSGACFGEKALLSKGKRSATVNALTDVTTLGLSRPLFFKMLFWRSDIFNEKGIVSRERAYSGIQVDKRRRRRLSEKKTIAQMEKISILGVGGFGTVWKIRDKTTNEYYALKVIPQKKYKGRERYVTSEKETMEEVSSSNFVVQLYSSFSDSVNQYFLMELCYGGDLKSLLRKERVFTEDTAKFYTAGIIAALEHLHEKHIVYRDLKLENILLDRNGYPKLCDFGLAKKLSPENDVTHTFCGTVSYLSPEAITHHGKGYTKKIDLWSLGICIYEMLCGHLPFTGSYAATIKKAIVNGKMAFSNEFSIDSKLLIRRLCQKAPKKRVFHKRFKSAFDGIRHTSWFMGFDFDAFAKHEVDAPHTNGQIPTDSMAPQYGIGTKIDSGFSCETVTVVNYRTVDYVSSVDKENAIPNTTARKRSNLWSTPLDVADPQIAGRSTRRPSNRIRRGSYKYICNT